MKINKIIILLISNSLGIVLGCDANNRCPSSAPCCSQYGYCGSTAEYCNTKCNPAGSFNTTSCSASLKVKRHHSKEKDHQCPDAFKTTFEKGLPSTFTYDGPVVADNGHMVVKFSQGSTPNPKSGIIQGYGGTVTSAKPYLYGKFKARMKTGRIGGIVTAFILMSDQKDEIDWEWTGKDEMISQTNYFSKGAAEYTRGVFFKSAWNTHKEFHEYGIEWTKDSIVWTVDGTKLREVKRDETLKDGVYQFPDTAAYIKLNLWDGSAEAEGTRDWAGGMINYNDPEYVQNGGFISAEVEWLSYDCH